MQFNLNLRRYSKMRINLEEKKAEDGKVFHYAEIGYGKNYPDFRLWVPNSLVQSDKPYQPEKDFPKPDVVIVAKSQKFIEFPLQATISQGKSKSTLILKPSADKVVHNVLIPCGFRGDSSFEILSPKAEDLKVFNFKNYESPRGNLGVSAGALVESPAGAVLTVHWEKSGRLYGEPAEGTSLYYPNGEVRDVAELDAMNKIDESKDAFTQDLERRNNKNKGLER